MNTYLNISMYGREAGSGREAYLAALVGQVFLGQGWLVGQNSAASHSEVETHNGG